jgi:hypothetical protein
MISIDFDLQDDPAVLEQMVQAFIDGKQLVYGVRRKRDTDTWFKKQTALAFYRFMLWMGVDVLYNHADFRLLSNRVLLALEQYRESNLFLRGIMPLLGFPTATVQYDRLERKAGTSKYPFFRMLGLAIDAITSFSNRPLRLISLLGLLTFGITLLLSAWVLLVFIQGKTVPGWASITLPVYFIAGVQLLCLGIIGEYVSKIYLETKRRPLYHVEQRIGFTETDKS